jgi:hypothetical protein
MAVTYAAAAKTARMTAIRDALNGGSLVIYHSDGTTVLATFTLSATSGSVSGSVLTFSLAAGTVTAAATGTATTAKFKTSAAADYITGLTVGAGSGDVNLNTTTVGSGANVTISSAAITHV